MVNPIRRFIDRIKVVIHIKRDIVSPGYGAGAKRPVKEFAWTNTLVRNVAHFQFDLSSACVTIGKPDKNPKCTIKEWKISVSAGTLWKSVGAIACYFTTAFKMNENISQMWLSDISTVEQFQIPLRRKIAEIKTRGKQVTNVKRFLALFLFFPSANLCISWSRNNLKISFPTSFDNAKTMLY